MALGYCPKCEKLVPITPGEWVEKPTAASGGKRAWRPVAHDDDAGKPCPGKAIR